VPRFDRLPFRRGRTTFVLHFFSISLIRSISQAKCAYRSIGEFIKHVTSKDSEYLEIHPFPEFSSPLKKIEKQSEMKTVRTLYNEECSTSPDSDVEVCLKNPGIIMEEARDNDKAKKPIDLSSPSSSGKTTNGTPEQSDSSKKSWKVRVLLNQRRLLKSV
jgi:hypothetical protein